uniref:Phosphatidic acid phosphatase type 2/haloperoxidase domain-containing protein n=1 Tax=Clastoptera arizonana TaxID=38151 RepID=A0A1B6C2C2_9HEMI
MGDRMASIRKHRGSIVDVICVALVGLAVGFDNLFGVPYKRGFFCDDDTIRYPRQSETVPTALLAVVGYSVPAILVGVVETLRLFDKTTPRDSYRTVSSRILRSCYRILGVFLFGTGLNQLCVDTSKYVVGRLRPHFIDVCVPTVDCNTIAGNTYVTQYECTGDPAVVEEARLSFPSGHAALAFYVAIYLSIFLQHRMVWQGTILFRHLLQGILILLAWYTALTRVRDNMHHPTDVLAGSVIGTLWAFFMACFVIDMRLENENDQEELRVLRQTQIQNQHGPNYV